MSDRRRQLLLALLLVIGILPFELNGWYNPLLSPREFWLAEFIAWIILPSAILLVARRMRLVTFRELGFHTNIRGKKIPWRFALLMIVCPIFFYYLDQWAVDQAPILLPINYLDQHAEYPDWLPPPGPTTGWWRLLGMVYLAGSAGFVEEIFYRAMMSKLFRRTTLGTLAYVIVSVTIFAAAHWEFGIREMFEAAVFGCAAAVLFRVTDNIWPLIVSHVIVDFLWFAS
jgi:membrane protease YdiL (CAAX protease family)